MAGKAKSSTFSRQLWKWYPMRQMSERRFPPQTSLGSLLIPYSYASNPLSLQSYQHRDKQKNPGQDPWHLQSSIVETPRSESLPILLWVLASFYLASRALFMSPSPFDLNFSFTLVDIDVPE
ncbi:hypothetical protein LZ31DRAFT_551105 [Colletotrichum somersetense]|nr:hypothetical protein LZ31DRAFT_551105 [Colletotrichum somersetense]